MRTEADQAKAGLSRRQATALLVAAPLLVVAARRPQVDEEALRQAYDFTIGLG